MLVIFEDYERFRMVSYRFPIWTASDEAEVLDEDVVKVFERQQTSWFLSRKIRDKIGNV